MRPHNLSLFSDLPEGFFYEPDFLTVAEEAELLRIIATLQFKPFDFHGYVAKRRVVEYGWEYDFGTRQTTVAEPIPDFLLCFRDRAAAVIGISPGSIIEAVITEYPTGAPIGWHRDVPQFDRVIGISLGSSCRMRLKPYRGAGKIISVVLEPRSMYGMSGPARWKYQHSIPPVEKLRYSITLRTLRSKQNRENAA